MAEPVRVAARVAAMVEIAKFAAWPAAGGGGWAIGEVSFFHAAALA